MSEQANPSGYEVGRRCGSAIERMKKVDEALKLVFTALIVGGHLDAAEIVNKQRLQLVYAKQDVIEAIHAGGVTAVHGYGARTR